MHAYFVSTLTLPSKKHFLNFYNQRGGAEVEQFRQDKSGLALGIRRKQSFTGQTGYILLTDLAHNLLADFSITPYKIPLSPIMGLNASCVIYYKCQGG